MAFFNQVMIFGAGRGTRLAPLTDTCPKPLIPLHKNETTLSRILDMLNKESFDRCIVLNTHHLSHLLQDYCGQHYPKTKLIYENSLLETAGGLQHALPLFDIHKPIVCINGDSIWESSPLALIQEAWDPKAMDILMVVIPQTFAIGYQGMGDYHITPGNYLRYRSLDENAPYVYGGLCVLSPKALSFLQTIAPPLSLKVLFDIFESQKRLKGVIYNDHWGDIGSPHAYASILNFLSTNE